MLEVAGKTPSEERAVAAAPSCGRCGKHGDGVGGTFVLAVANEMDRATVVAAWLMCRHNTMLEQGVNSLFKEQEEKRESLLRAEHVLADASLREDLARRSAAAVATRVTSAAGIEGQRAAFWLWRLLGQQPRSQKVQQFDLTLEDAFEEVPCQVDRKRAASSEWDEPPNKKSPEERPEPPSLEQQKEEACGSIDKRCRDLNVLPRYWGGLSAAEKTYWLLHMAPADVKAEYCAERWAGEP